MSRRNRLGTVSLAVAAGGMVVVDGALHLGWVEGPGWRIAAAGFEAGTVGGMADWFAVTALFREVPIPGLRRHTNILVKHRRRFSQGIVDVVTNKWLAPEALAERLAQFSASSALTAFLSRPEREAWAVGVAREVLARLAAQLDGPDLVRLVQRALVDQVKALPLGPPLGAWLEKTLRDGRHHELWRLALDSLDKSLGDPAIVDVVAGLIHRAAGSYAADSTLRRLGVWLAETTGALDADAAARSVLDAVRPLLHAARQDESHPLRREVDEALRRFAHALATGEPETLGVVATLQARLVENVEAGGIIRGLLSRFRATVEAQLVDDASDLSSLLRVALRRGVRELESDPELAGRLDAWVRETVALLVRENHHVLGEIVQRSLDSLTDDALVEQVHDKVWADLQYIRLNGAVIGALVGIALASLKLLLT